jgi:hypothetical protein
VLGACRGWRQRWCIVDAVAGVQTVGCAELQRQSTVTDDGSRATGVWFGGGQAPTAGGGIPEPWPGWYEVPHG